MRTTKPKSLTGQVLLSHPAMRHDAFRHTVVFIASHDADGAMGVILNRPLRQTLGELAPGFATSTLSTTPLYEGGPMKAEHVAFGSLHWTGDGRYHVHFGLSKERAEGLLSQFPELRLFCFSGHAGWSPGQLEDELKRHAWVVSPLNPNLMKEQDGPALWRAFLSRYHPVLRLQAEMPEDLSRN
ncbi:MAG: YqgE/AlgH family protein [Puniceicoccales bacterium]|jgi:putative transcriptional regulator|nr:YqgE/AlgH family protein [Puniceicoccales bacterium]